MDVELSEEKGAIELTPQALPLEGLPPLVLSLDICIGYQIAEDEIWYWLVRNPGVPRRSLLADT